MASVTLKQTWIHDADDLDTSVRIPWSELTVEPSRQAQVRTYAGGRQRLVTGPARPRTATLTFPLVDRATLDTLEGWCGTRVFVRDTRGRTMFAMYPALRVSERRTDHRPSVSLTLHEITDSVEV